LRFGNSFQCYLIIPSPPMGERVRVRGKYIYWLHAVTDTSP
jgi:hypothetical protein